MSFKASICTCEKFLVAREPAKDRGAWWSQGGSRTPDLIIPCLSWDFRYVPSALEIRRFAYMLLPWVSRNFRFRASPVFPRGPEAKI
jgi:hypothetical protein